MCKYGGKIVIRVAHIITGLNTGGTEMMLYKLMSGTDREKFSPVVISLTDLGAVGVKIKDIGIPVETVGMQPGRLSVAAVWKLRRFVMRLQPAVIQGWLPHGNLASMAGAVNLFNRTPVLWNIRQSLNTIGNLADSKRATSMTIKLGARLSWFPQFIIYNNKTGMRHHEAIGYRHDKSRVIPNGFDTGIFKPLPYARQELRNELGLNDSTVLVGIVARYHPMKDHENFLRAAGQLINEIPEIHFVLVGQGADNTNSELMRLIKEGGISQKVHLLGERKDTPKINAALDIAVSSSRSEGFANVIGEAMACGTICVVTDVGDSSWIVGDTGKVVPPQNWTALAKALCEVLQMDPSQRKKLGLSARERVLSEFSLDKIVQLYENLYLEVLNG
jgi:glycosyltransferase involved in cell wall biosynthesis